MGNKYPGQCRCGEQVAAGAGSVQKIGRRWVVSCGECGPTADRSSRRESSGSVVTRFSSGAEVYRNRRGRCEDAPCCGCCS